MKTTRTLAIAALLLLQLVTYSFSKDANVTIKGLIEDSQCAYNVHANGRSHELMLKSGHGGTTEKDCTDICVKEMGGNYVLAVKNEVYKLDNQTLPEKFAGESVKVTGTLDTKTSTIHVTSIER